MRIKDKSIIKLPGSDIGKPGSDMGKLGSGAKWGDNEQVAFNPGANETTSSTQELIKNNSKPQGSDSVKYPSGAGMTPGSVGAGASGGAGTSVIRGVGSKSSIQKLAEDYVNSNYNDFTKGTDYESLVKRYSAQGHQAMDDTIGQMAARTGGLASSWAASAGQQAYGSWMEKLEDAARSLYDSQQSERLSKLNVAQGIYDRDVANEQWQQEFDRSGSQWQQEFDRSGEQWKYQTEQEATDDFKDSIYDAAYWGDVNWDDFKDNEYGITEAEFDRIVASAQGARGDDTYERTLAEKETEEDDLYAEIYYGGSYGSWEAYQKAGGTLDKRSYDRIVKQAQTDSAAKDEEDQEAFRIQVGEATKLAEKLWAGSIRTDNKMGYSGSVRKELKKEGYSDEVIDEAVGWIEEMNQEQGEAWQKEKGEEAFGLIDMSTYDGSDHTKARLRKELGDIGYSDWAIDRAFALADRAPKPPAPFVKANYLRQTESGNYVFEKGGKEIELEAGINPYTYTRNPDTKHGTFTNGYQPNNVNGNTLSEADYDGELYVNGVKQKVWETSDGQWYYWDGTQNKYIETSKEDLEEMANGE